MVLKISDMYSQLKATEYLIPYFEQVTKLEHSFSCIQ